MKCCKGVVGYFRFAAVILESKVLLPAFGSPIKPISAINFSRSQIHFSSNGPPGCAFLGA